MFLKPIRNKVAVFSINENRHAIEHNFNYENSQAQSSIDTCWLVSEKQFSISVHIDPWGNDDRKLSINKPLWNSINKQAVLSINDINICSEMKHNAHSKAVLDDSWITVDTTSLHQHKLYYCDGSSLSHSESGQYKLRDSKSRLGLEVGVWSPTKLKGCVIQCLAERKFGSAHRKSEKKKKNG